MEVGNWKLFPNPVEDELWLESPTLQKNLSVRIYNLQGKLVEEYPLGSGQRFHLNWTQPEGLYLLELRTSKGETWSAKVLSR